MRKSEAVIFDRGINNLIAPHLIDQNQGIYISNTQIYTGEIISERKATLENLPVASTGSSTYGFGKHTVHYKSKDLIVSSGVSHDINDPSSYFNEDRFYVEWAGFLYWSNFKDDGTGKIQRFDGTTTVDIGGHVPPTSTVTLAEDGAGLLKGDYSYSYTVTYNDVFESAPSPITDITGVVNKAVKITGLPTTGFSPEPTHITIYRSGGLNPTFNKVNRVEYGTSEYKDNTSDFKISRKELNTGTNDAPPANIDMLIESKGTLFGAVGDKIHFSKEGQPEYWSDYSYVQLPTDCTGLGLIGDTIVAFTETDMYAITGRNVNDVQVSKLPFHYGCLNKHTVKSLKGMLIWVTRQDERDLLCGFNGSEVMILNQTNKSIMSGDIDNFTYDYFTTETYDNFDYVPLSAMTTGRRYFLFLTGRTVILDMNTTPKITYMDETIQGAFEYHNSLMVVKEYPPDASYLFPYRSFRYSESNADRRNMLYMTKDFSDGSLLGDKDYRKIHVNGTGKWKIFVLVDGRSVFSFDYTQGSTIHLPSGTHGKLIAFHIKSDGYAKIKAIQYEYEYLESGYNTK